MSTRVGEVDGRRILFGNTETPLWPEDGISKGDLIDYYLELADIVLPFLVHRPLSLLRCPDGVNGECVYQKTAPPGLPQWIPTRRVRSDQAALGYTEYVIGSERALAGASTITRMARQREPSLFTFDMRRARRRGKILIDVLRNRRGATLVSPYAVREYPGAPVSAPLEWSELERSVYPEDFHFHNVRARLRQRGDPLLGFFAERQSLAPLLEGGRARRARPMA